MPTTIFLISRSVRSKSEADRCIETIAKRQCLPISHLGDYSILYRMYREDVQGLKFQPVNSRRPELGFRIIDPAVFEDALRQLQKQIQEIKQQAGILLVTLVGDNYDMFLKSLPSESYHSRYILYFEETLEGKNARAVNDFVRRVEAHMMQSIIPQALRDFIQSSSAKH
ncbi:MAG TPA: hypothetical protein VFV38_09905 [Ktedonobacteraceae bacterium]|nr:hypothetical protein [Ktedonobacteraceae bacterium]